MGGVRSAKAVWQTHTDGSCLCFCSNVRANAQFGVSLTSLRIYTERVDNEGMKPYLGSHSRFYQKLISHLEYFSIIRALM